MNIEKRKASRKAWKIANKEWVAEYQAAYLKKWVPKNKDKVAKAAKKYAQANSGKMTAKAVNRLAEKAKRTPSWLSEIHLEEIRNFYKEAQDLRWLSNEPLEVDHIVPLRGKEVSGLHVPWNLQILPASLNAAKSNKLVTV